MKPRKSEPKPTKQPGWLNKADMARSLGISVQAFDKWGVEPEARIGREAFFTAGAVLSNRLAHHQQKTESRAPTVDDEDYEAQRTRLTKAQADAQEMKNEVMRREQAPVRLLELALENLSTRVVAVLQAIPSTVKKRIPHLTATEINQISREVIKAQNAASKLELPWDQLEGLD